MIKKVLKIKNVGRFSNYNSWSEELSFFENTLIFGENTNGKSTLTAIFRSLRNGDSNYLSDRKTFGESDNQEVKILIGTNHVKEYGKDIWIENNIEVFDNEFIHRNVFYGDMIDDEQRAGLYNIFIGNSSKKMVEEIKGLKREQTSLETQRDRVIRDNLREQIDFLDFYRLKEKSKIDSKIKDKEDRIKQQENLFGLKELLKNTMFKMGFEDLKNDFKKTIDTSVEAIISNHIKENWSNPEYSENILSEGTSLLKEKNPKCVYCSQEFKTEESKKLILSFKQKFSEEYNNLKKIVEQKGNKFIHLDLEKECLEFTNLGFEVNFFKKALVAKKEVDKKIIEKQKNLNLSIDFDIDETFKVFEIEFIKTKNKILKFERTIDVVADLGKLKKELKDLRINKNRFNKTTKEWIEKYESLQGKIKEKKELINEKTNQLQEIVDDIFSENKENINYYLGELYADFKIDDFFPKKHMGKKNPHYCQYNFIFEDEHRVNENRFKTTFSDSDKRLLAFSFFLSQLKNDENLGNKIIILDDPFSSFDENRKRETVVCLNSVVNNKDEKPKQKIILTHEKSFLVMNYHEMAKSGERVRVLKIHRNENGSSLVVVDIKNDFLKEDYFKNLESIKNSTESGDFLNESLKKARPCMEHLLKRKYYFYLSPNTIETKSITSYIEEIGEVDLAFKKQDLFNLSLHEEMHDGNPIFNLSDRAKINKLKDFLNLIGKI